MVVLNPQQKIAVEHRDGPMIVVAGAGTGKTRVITHRIAHLVTSGIARPSQILALTFTDKAAEEMLSRVDEMMPLGYEEIAISTFHAFCDSLLKESGLEIGLDTHFEILTKAKQWLVVKQNLFDFDLNYYRPLGNPTKFIDALLTHFSRAKDELVTPEEYIAFARDQASASGFKTLDHLAEVDLSTLGEDQLAAFKLLEVAHAYQVYQHLLTRNKDRMQLDFGDLIMLALELLRRRPAVLKRYQEQYRYVMVDEFQDTNYAQNELTKLLAGERQNLMVVGDDDQSIYRFRGAAVSNILQFKSDFPDTEMVVLDTNYRSTQPILDNAYQLIQNNNPDRLEVKNNIVKRLKAVKTGEREVEVLHTASLDEETEAVARAILDLRGALSEKHEERLSSSDQGSLDMFAPLAAPQKSELKWSDFAILARANAHLEPFVATLRYHGIPFKMVGSRGLYVREEIKDLIAFLRVLADPTDALELYRLMCFAPLGISHPAILLLLKFAKQHNRSLFASLDHLDEIEGIADEDKEHFLWLKQYIDTQREHLMDHNPGELLLNFVTESKYYDELTRDETLENFTKVQNIRLFFDKIKAFLTDSDDKTVPGFVTYLEAMMEAGDNPATAEMDSSLDAVSVMTVHASKGLEFECVFVTNLVQQRFPSRSRRDTIELPEAFIKEQLPEGDEHLEEERRLFYVAMTRAKRYLYLTYADSYGGQRLRKPSPFIQEALGAQVRHQAVTPAVTSFAESKATVIPSEGDLTQYVPQLFSYSQLSTFETCPLKYKYAYVYRLPTKPERALVFGNILHRTFKDFYTGLAHGKSATYEALENLLERNWSREGFATSDEVALQHERALKIIERFWAENESQFAPAAYLEKSFVFKSGAHSFTGFIDRIDELPDKTFEIIDYKTGAIASQKALQDRVAKDEQLSLYALAAREVLNIDVSKYTLYFVEQGMRASAPRLPAQLEVAEAKFAATAEQIRRSDFVATPGKQICSMCAYRNLCPFAAD